MFRVIIIQTCLPKIHSPASYYSSGFAEFDVAHLVFDGQQHISCTTSIIFAVVQGSGYVETDGYKHMLQTGTVFYVPPNTIFDMNSTNTLDVWIAVGGASSFKHSCFSLT